MRPTRTQPPRHLRLTSDSRRRGPPTPSPPTDQQRFRSWFDAAVAGRDAGRGFYDGNGLPFMSEALRERIPDQGLVHCWVRTHEMVRRSLFSQLDPSTSRSTLPIYCSLLCLTRPAPHAS